MLSNCCFAPPLGELFDGGEKYDGIPLGRCSQCKEGALFKEEGEDNEQS